MRPLILFCVVVLVLDGCIDRFYVSKQDNDQIILIEGMITDRPGPYEVKLSYANNISEQLNFIDKVQKATILLLDNEASAETLTEISPGTYQTSNVRGIVGHQYRIRVSLSDGSVYESLPETLLPVGKLERVYYEFDAHVRPSVKPIPPSPGLNVYVDASVVPEQAGLVRWRTIGTWENATFPELRIIPSLSPRGEVIVIHDPPRCAGSDRRRCTCCYCWMTNYDPEPVLSDPLFHKEKVKRQFVSFVPAYANVFYDKFHLKVEQMSVSENIYQFWDMVKTQKQKGSDLFQTPASKLTGNIKNVNGSTRVIGYFGASSVRDTSFFITRDAIPYQLPLIDTVKDSCLYGNPFATNKRPSFWN
jgi:hypothetical protein